MGKCLVQKLNGVVDNDSLLKLNEIKLRISSSDTTCRVGISSSEHSTKEIVITAINGTAFAGGESSIVIPSGYHYDQLLSFAEGETSVDISIIDKNDINGLITTHNQGNTTNTKITLLSDVEYLENLQQLEPATYDFNYKKLNIPGQFGGNTLGGEYTRINNLSLNDCVTHERMPYIQRIFLGPSGIIGNLSEAFGRSTNVTKISMNKFDFKYGINNNISGSLEELSETLVANGKTSGSLYFSLWDNVHTKLLKTDTNVQEGVYTNVYYSHFNPTYTPEHAAVENVFFRNGFAISKSSTPPEV